VQPQGGYGAAMHQETPLECRDFFPNSDVFSIPAIDGPSGESVSSVSISNETPLPLNWQATPVRQLLSLLAVNSPEVSFTGSRLLRAFHIAQWRQESLFCGKCGGKNSDCTSGEVARSCTACGHIEFPRIAPAIITIIMNDQEQVLLAHNKKFVPGLYSLIAGFVEAGENLEEAVARETREEAGIEIKDIQYAVSQPWPFPNSLMVGFSARYAHGTIKPDGIEIEDAQWFSRDRLPALPSAGSVSRLLIERWLGKNPC